MMLARLYDRLLKARQYARKMKVMLKPLKFATLRK